MSTAPAKFNPPKSCWLPAEKGKGLELFGTFSRKGGQMAMEVTINNKAMQVGNKEKMHPLIQHHLTLKRLLSNISKFNMKRKRKLIFGIYKKS